MLSSSSSFSPKLTKFLQQYTCNFFKFTRTLLAFASDSHKYLISLQRNMLSSSTAHAARTKLLSPLSQHPSIFNTLSEGNASSETSLKLGHFFI
ncbi:hypothetical protein HanIR_Chr07g0328251 [Helianthus annuus]|nr:hypothetical protein HanIR_Chr07g0328251 [Helianthus annuus]